MILNRLHTLDRKVRSDGRTITQIFSGAHYDGRNNLMILVSEIPAGTHEGKHYHRNSAEAFFFLSEADISINGKQHSLKSGDFICFDPGERHEIVAHNDITVLVVKCPNIDDKVVEEEN